MVTHSHERRKWIRVADLVCIVWASFGAQIARFGLNQDTLSLGDTIAAPYWVVSVLVIVSWWIVLGLSGSRENLVLGYGSEEYKRVINSTLSLFGSIAIFSYVFQLDTARGYVAIALPLGILSLLVGRWSMRMLLVSARQRGIGVKPLIIIGGPVASKHLHRQLKLHPEAGFVPVATYHPGYGTDYDSKIGSNELPNLGTSTSLSDITSAISDSSASAVAITTGASVEPDTIRQLGWYLAKHNISLIIAPALTDVTGPRIHTYPVAGLPLIHVTTPQLAGYKRLAKRAFDLAISFMLLLLFAGPMAATAILVRLDSPGPAFFRQTRVGRSGVPFTMYKFRSMVVNAESKAATLMSGNDGAGLLFKLKADPRVTRLGRIIRGLSIDELPQLVNVVKGEMSLVGPRPPLPGEVAKYDDSTLRRLLVQPGITGLWQVSGRSDLSWEESVRLDLYYVENWSMTNDLVILIRTFKAVLAKRGAY